MITTNDRVDNIYGQDVFSRRIMQQRLPKEVYKSLLRTIDRGQPLDPQVADVVAATMKDWAIENGATHFTHWFQPLTGLTAENAVEVAAHNVRLTADLQHSRQELVTTREEERRRIRRDLHDGIGPLLASQSLTLEAIEKLIDQNPDLAGSLVRDMRDQSQMAIQEVRNLIYNLRPPSLDDLGLVTSLQQQFTRASGKEDWRFTSTCTRLCHPCRLPPRPPSTASLLKPLPTLFVIHRRTSVT